MAEHWPVQLLPRPQVTLVNLVSRPQQPTEIDSLEKVKAESKKSTSVVLALPLKRYIRILVTILEFRRVLWEIPSFIEEDVFSLSSMVRWRIEPACAEDEGLAENTLTS